MQYKVRFLIIHASKSRCLPRSIQNLDKREFTMAAMLLHFPSFQLVNIHTSAHTCTKRKKTTTSTMSTKTTASAHSLMHAAPHGRPHPYMGCEQYNVTGSNCSKRSGKPLIFIFIFMFIIRCVWQSECVCYVLY